MRRISSNATAYDSEGFRLAIGITVYEDESLIVIGGTPYNKGDLEITEEEIMQKREDNKPGWKIIL